MKLMNRVLPSCREVSQLNSQAMDEALSLRKRLALRLHLWMCVWCRRSHEHLHTMRDMARRQSVSASESSRLSSEARKRIAQALDQDDQQA